MIFFSCLCRTSKSLQKQLITVLQLLFLALLQEAKRINSSLAQFSPNLVTHQYHLSFLEMQVSQAQPLVILIQYNWIEDQESELLMLPKGSTRFLTVLSAISLTDKLATFRFMFILATSIFDDYQLIRFQNALPTYIHAVYKIL